jgi:hypothetical protein
MIEWLMNMEQLEEWELEGETEVLGKKKEPAIVALCPPQITRPGLGSNPCRQGANKTP